MPNILITPRSFASYDQKPYELLEENGFTVIKHPMGSILSKEEMKRYIHEADAVIAGVDPLDAEVLKCAPNLKIISKYGVGTDNIDLTYCREHDIEVTVTRGANREAVADYAFTLMLAVARRVAEIDSGCRNGDWKKRIAVDVYGKKLGILGLGAIGRGVAERAKGFAMELYGFDVVKDETFLDEYNMHFTDAETIMSECDFVSIHLPLTEDTHHLIDRSMLQKAKSNLILVNTARGGIVDENDLYDAICAKEIAGAGIDVFEIEPADNSKLLVLPEVIIGSHCAASTVGAVDNMSRMAVDNVLSKWKEDNHG